MIRRVERHNRARPAGERVRISVEVEKPRDELLPLLGLGHVVRGQGVRDGAGLTAVGGANGCRGAESGGSWGWSSGHRDRVQGGGQDVGAQSGCSSVLESGEVQLEQWGTAGVWRGGVVCRGCSCSTGVQLWCVVEAQRVQLGSGGESGCRGRGAALFCWGPGGAEGCRSPTAAPLLQVFISKDLAQHFGYRSAPEALQGLRDRVQPG